MTPEDITKLAFLLYPHITASAEGVTIESLAQRIKVIQRGLLPEDEFFATACWLGNCGGIHRIDQTPMPLPSPSNAMRAPDFIAFPIIDGNPLPVLIEVKSQEEKRLDWSADYLATLRRFADCVGLPLLVAWKAWDIWTLVDVAHFERNVTGYRLTLEKALREDLSCVLFRNVRVQMNPDLALILTMRILDQVNGDTETLLPQGWLKMEVVKAGYYRDGVQIKEYDKRHSMLFLASADNAELRRTGKQECEQIFRPAPDHSFTLSNILVAQLSLGNTDDAIDWHRVLTQPLSSSGAKLRDSLRAAIDSGFVRYVMDIIPNTWPTFLPKK